MTEVLRIELAAKHVKKSRARFGRNLAVVGFEQVNGLRKLNVILTESIEDSVNIAHYLVHGRAILHRCIGYTGVAFLAVK